MLIELSMKILNALIMYATDAVAELQGFGLLNAVLRSFVLLTRCVFVVLFNEMTFA